MRNTSTIAVLLLGLPALAGAAAPASLAGRWDLTIQGAGGQYPSWLEVAESGAETTLRMVGGGGSVHPVKLIESANGHLKFSDGDSVFDCHVEGRSIAGNIAQGNAKPMTFTGERVPALKRAAQRAWRDPVYLFNGKDLDGWKLDHPSRSGWKADGGKLVNRGGSSNIVSTRTFDDFRLHVEFNCAKGQNSGVYLRGRYEVQIEDDPEPEDKFHRIGSIYGFIAPSPELPRMPGEWQSYDITLAGRRVSVVQNGVVIIQDQEIPGITGGALDSHEGLPGPIYLQGDHTGLEYRNIYIVEPAK